MPAMPGGGVSMPAEAAAAAAAAPTGARRPDSTSSCSCFSLASSISASSRAALRCATALFSRFSRSCFSACALACSPVASGGDSGERVSELPCKQQASTPMRGSCHHVQVPFAAPTAPPHPSQERTSASARCRSMAASLPRSSSISAATCCCAAADASPLAATCCRTDASSASTRCRCATSAAAAAAVAAAACASRASTDCCSSATLDSAASRCAFSSCRSGWGAELRAVRQGAAGGVVVQPSLHSSISRRSSTCSKGSLRAVCSVQPQPTPACGAPGTAGAARCAAPAPSLARFGSRAAWTPAPACPAAACPPPAPRRAAAAARAAPPWRATGSVIGGGREGGWATGKRSEPC